MRHMRVLEYVNEVARTGSIRRAAEQLNFTASALTRRIMDLEQEIGAELFERTARGMRLTAAGELFVAHARAQLADVDRLKSGIEDLKGLRRGLVRVACSQALALDFLPRAIGAFRRRFPLVNFDVRVIDHEQAMVALQNYDVDIAVVFRPALLPDFQQIATIPQRLVVLMAPDHPLAAQKPLRLSDCARYPAAMPDRSTGGRQMLDAFAARTRIRFQAAVESNSFELLRQSVVLSGLISFQIEIGAPANRAGAGIVVRPVDRRDTPEADLVMGQLRGRSLPLACAIFAEHIAGEMKTIRDGG